MRILYELENRRLAEASNPGCHSFQDSDGMLESATPIVTVLWSGVGVDGSVRR